MGGLLIFMHSIKQVSIIRYFVQKNEKCSEIQKGSQLMCTTMCTRCIHQIYICAFARCFYSKQCSVHSCYTFFMCFPGARTPEVCIANTTLYQLRYSNIQRALSAFNNIRRTVHTSSSTKSFYIQGINNVFIQKFEFLGGIQKIQCSISLDLFIAVY